MPNIHKNLKEFAFEEHIEAELARLHSFRKRNAETDYDKVTTIDKELLFEFLRTSQGDKLARLEEIYGDALEERVVRRIDEEIGKRGVIDVLRKGVEEGPVRLEFIFLKPATTLNPDVERLYRANIFSITRQVKFSQSTEQSIDMVIFVNGLPIITAELKNEITSQNVQHAMRQYRNDRDPREKLFSFKRCIAHFAVDTSEAFVATHLKEDRTFFLPFNKGFELGAGNPSVEGKHKTHYLWEELWSPEALCALVQSFVHAYKEVKEDRTGREYTEETQLFPRYHQWRAVLDILSNSREVGAGKNYLIQHSAGSGKSLTIAWLAYGLAELHNERDEKVYDTVIVLTDRRVLDKQLRNTIKGLEAKEGVLLTVGDKDTSTKLREGLEQGAKIITSTIQKFPVIVDTIGDIPAKRFALIVDEAHSSQSGETVRAVQEVLGDEEGEDWLEEQLLSRKQPGNLSYFAFTATPKRETIERFGEKYSNGSFAPFSLYSMKQAIEEKFIIDVLTNYTTYKTYFKLLKKLVDDPTVPRGRALSAILQHVSLHPETLNDKIEVIMGHFEQTVRDLLRGDSKAMIVTNSRKAAVLYKLALDAYLREHNFPYKTLAAFTDTVDIDGVPYTETSINDGVPEDNTAREFKKPEYRFLIVAEKYQTGFDEPFLCAMYVDKHLSGVQAVQTLSRLNRTTRDKEEVHVLDFVNEAEEIRLAFEPYYASTILSEGTDINSLNDFRSALHEVYKLEDAVLDGFIELVDPEADEIHARANAYLDDIANRIVETLPRKDDGNEDEYGKFLSIGNVYVKRYPYLAQVIGYSDVSHEKLYLFLKYLLKKLPKDPRKPLIEIVKYIDMNSVRVVRKLKASIALTVEPGDLAESEIIPGAPPEEVEGPLSELLDDVNKRWGVEFGKEQQETLSTMGEELASNNELQDVVANNVRQNASIHFEKVFDEKVDDQFDIDRKLWEQLRNNPELNEYIQKKMFRYVADKIFALREQ